MSHECLFFFWKRLVIDSNCSQTGSRLVREKWTFAMTGHGVSTTEEIPGEYRNSKRGGVRKFKRQTYAYTRCVSLALRSLL